MDQAENIDRYTDLTADIDYFTRLTKSRVEYLYTRTEGIIKEFEQNTELRVNRSISALTPGIEAVTTNVNILIFRVTFHASPEVLAILAAMVHIYNIVRIAVFVTNVIKIVGTIFQIHKIVAALWPKYREAYERLLTRVSEASAAIGWGVDGIGHLMNAAVGGINVLGGLMGKNFHLTSFEFMERGNDLIQTMSRMFDSLEADPGKWLTILFENNNMITHRNTENWWKNTSDWITEGLDRAEEALQGVSGIISEVQSIQNNMPEVVRQNIPIGLWLGLSSAQTTINDVLLPRVTDAQRQLEQINNVIGTYSEKFTDIAHRLRHPGDMLSEVDNLYPWQQQSQLNQIDDVTSREFDFWTEEERSEIQHDLDDFDRIDRALSAPTPEPGFMSLEAVNGKSLRGIEVEYQETWMIGGYNDPR